MNLKEQEIWHTKLKHKLNVPRTINISSMER